MAMKRMKNKESNVRQIQFKEVPVDYTEPKKSTNNVKRTGRVHVVSKRKDAE